MSKLMYMDSQYAGITPINMSLVDFFYPVGCYFETSDSSFNPNNTWGGTWEKEAEGKVHVSAGSTYTVGSEYGANTHVHTTYDHTLTENEIPSHSHGPSYLTGCFDLKRIVGNYTINNYVSGICTLQNPGPRAAEGVLAGGSGNSSASRVDINATHTHSAAGGGWAHNHGDTSSSSSWQPSVAVVRWHRTA